MMEASQSRSAAVSLGARRYTPLALMVVGFFLISMVAQFGAGRPASELPVAAQAAAAVLLLSLFAMLGVAAFGARIESIPKVDKALKVALVLFVVQLAASGVFLACI